MTASPHLLRSRVRAFTLIELMVSVALMVILMGSVALIFFQGSQTVVIAEARSRVYLAARMGLDQMERDLAGCLSYGTGNQRLWMRDNAIPNGTPAPDRHVKKAADVIAFRATTLIGGSVRTAMIRYILRPEMDPALPGTPKTTRRTGRTLYVLQRELTDLVDAAGSDPLVTAAPVASAIVAAVPPAMPVFPCAGRPLLDDNGTPIQPQELIHYVISFNIEYLSDQYTFSQLGAPGTVADYFPPNDPLGFNINAGGLVPDKNDPASPSAVPPPPPGSFAGYRVPGLRVTLRVIEDVEERSERVITREIKIPMG